MDLTAVGDAVVAFLQTDLALYIAGGLALSGALAQLAALTPWGYDDKAANFLSRIFKVLAGNWGKAKSQEKPQS